MWQAVGWFFVREGGMKPGSPAPYGTEVPWERVRQRALAHLLAHGVPEPAAEDAIQEALIALLQVGHPLPCEGAYICWVRKAAWHIWLNQRRKDRPIVWLAELACEPACPLCCERWQFVSMVSPALSREDRMLLEMRLQGYTCVEIAEKLGSTEEAIKKRWQRLCKYLRDEYAKTEEGEAVITPPRVIQIPLQIEGDGNEHIGFRLTNGHSPEEKGWNGEFPQSLSACNGGGPAIGAPAAHFPRWAFHCPNLS